MDTRAIYILDPLSAARLVDRLTDAEAEELYNYAEAAGDEPAAYIERATEWLIWKFGRQQ